MVAKGIEAGSNPVNEVPAVQKLVSKSRCPSDLLVLGSLNVQEVRITLLN